jgi:hypothetical protein
MGWELLIKVLSKVLICLKSNILLNIIEKKDQLPFDKTVFDLFIGPIDEELVVEIGFLSKSSCKVDRNL